LTTDETEGDRRSIGAGLKETFKNDFVEFRVGTTGEETVESYEKEEVNVF
jgi:hypothetical protein